MLLAGLFNVRQVRSLCEIIKK